MKQLFILLAALFGLSVPATHAQVYPGSWEIFPNYNTPTAIIETPEYVYTLAGTSLCGYDKATGEVMAFNSGNRLNGNQVSGIWYDPQEKYLFIAYNDFNIDLLYDDGRTINVPDLRDAAINSDKKINHVAFSNGNAYVALNCGMLVVDAAHGAVTESCLWGFKLDFIAATPKKLLVFSTAPQGGSKWHVGELTGSHHNFSKAFTPSAKTVYPHGAVVPLGPDAIMIGNSTNAHCLKIDNEATDNAKAITSTDKIQGVTGLTKAAAGKMQISKTGATAAGGGNVYHIGADGTLVNTYAAANSNIAADWDFADSKLWIADATGYGRYDLAANAFDIAPLKPNSTSGSNVGIFRQAPDGTIYMSTISVAMGGTGYGLSYGKKPQFNTYKDGKLTQILPAGPGNTLSLYGFILNPANNDEVLLHYFGKAGLANITEDKVLWYNRTNSTLYESPVNSMAIDSHGNLWVVQWDFSSGCLLHKALDGGWQTGDASKWSEIQLKNFRPGHNQHLILDEARRNLIMVGGDGVLSLKMPSANEPLSDKCEIAITNANVDSDGNIFDGAIRIALAIDKNDWIWGGKDSGVYVIPNSDNIYNIAYAPTRPKVPRNDGTNLADYLLDQIEIIDIAVDENNQKWISTIGSGLYRVSADGTEILEHFTTENSLLPSDNVFACLPDKFSNKIFIGTDQGLAIYHSTTTAAAPNYNDVYAYPNPVTPDYTGWITVKGLMNNSLVKIADAAGRVFFEGKSDGGMVTWNGCDASGRRVKSGVYFVFASQNQEGVSSNAAVTKIVVVN